MTPKTRPGGSTPTFEFIVRWTPDQMAHYFKAVANYQALLTQEGEDIIPIEHPVVELQLMIVDRILPLIGTGVANGWNVRGLIEIQNLLNQAIQDRRDDEQA